MLHGALRQILPFGNELRFQSALDQRARYAAQAKLDCECDTDRTSADDDDLMAFPHVSTF